MGRSYQGYARPPPGLLTSHAQGTSAVVSHSPHVLLRSPPLYISLPPSLSAVRSPGPSSLFLPFFHSALPSPPSWLPPFLARLVARLLLRLGNACVNRKVEVHTRACGNASRNAGQRSYGTTSGAFSLRFESCRTLHQTTPALGISPLSIEFSLYKEYFFRRKIYVRVR